MMDCLGVSDKAIFGVNWTAWDLGVRKHRADCVPQKFWIILFTFWLELDNLVKTFA